MGIESPNAFPPELAPYFSGSHANGDEDPDVGDELWDVLSTNPYAAVIRSIFEALTNVWAFYAAYVEKVADDDGGPLYDIRANIETAMMDLAACKIDVDENFAPNMGTFRYRVKKEYQEWLTLVKDAAFRAGTPLGAELLDMIGEDAGGLGHTAEAESLGLNANRLHPDVYMNELLVGMRMIHQVLPAILKKLEIDDFEFDESDFYIKSGSAAKRKRISEPRLLPTSDVN